MINHLAAIFGIALPTGIGAWYAYLRLFARKGYARTRAPRFVNQLSGPGDIGLTQISGKVGIAIRIGQWINRDGFRDYEHAFVYIGDGKHVEAQPGGAAVAQLSQHDASRVLWIHCPDEYRQAVVNAALSLVGTPYGFLDYLAIALHRFGLPFERLRDYVKSTAHMICSQLAVEAAHRGGWMLSTPHELAQDITPGDLSKIAMDQIEAGR